MIWLPVVHMYMWIYYTAPYTNDTYHALLEECGIVSIWNCLIKQCTLNIVAENIEITY